MMRGTTKVSVRLMRICELRERHHLSFTQRADNALRLLRCVGSCWMMLSLRKADHGPSLVTIAWSMYESNHTKLQVPHCTLHHCILVSCASSLALEGSPFRAGLWLVGVCALSICCRAPAAVQVDSLRCATCRNLAQYDW